MAITDKEQTTNTDLEAQFEFFLDKVKLNKATMPAIQTNMMRQAFYAGFAQFITIIMYGFAEKSEGWAEQALTDIDNQTRAFCAREMQKHQAGNN